MLIPRTRVVLLRQVIRARRCCTPSLRRDRSLRAMFRGPDITASSEIVLKFRNGADEFMSGAAGAVARRAGEGERDAGFTIPAFHMVRPRNRGRDLFRTRLLCGAGATRLFRSEERRVGKECRSRW